MNLTVKEISQAIGTTIVDAPAMITGVEFDSRLIQPGNLFVPLAGVRDGHEFIAQAKENGAIATLWSWDLADAPLDLFVIPVAETKEALQQLAVYYQQKVAPKVIAITGSNGKTTTKDMTEAVLAQRFRTYKTQGNYNNDIGMPYTVLHMPVDTEMLILEMGMDHADEITVLSKLAQPDAAAITMIGEAHIENLGSRAGIAAAKMEIVDGLAADGLLLVPAEEALLAPLTSALPQQVTTFGLIETADIRGEIVSEAREETVFTVAGETFTIPVLGSYNVKNALIAYEFGRHFGLDTQAIARGLAMFELTKNRTQWLKAQNGADLLSDVYNANPTAMGLVLDSFGKLTLPGRRMAVLADMLELGPDSLTMHAAMADHIGENYDHIFLYGEQMEALAQRLAVEQPTVAVTYFTDKTQLMATLQATLLPTDSLLLKGSNGMGLSEVVIALQ